MELRGRKKSAQAGKKFGADGSVKVKSGHNVRESLRKKNLKKGLTLAEKRVLYAFVARENENERLAERDGADSARKRIRRKPERGKKAALKIVKKKCLTRPIQSDRLRSASKFGNEKKATLFEN